MIEEGLSRVGTALCRGRAGPYQIQAAIAAVHTEAEDADSTDWPQIVGLYALLLERQATPVVELNHAVAVGMAFGPADGLRLIERLESRGAPRGYHLLSVARAELAARQGDRAEAERAFRCAIEECSSPAPGRTLRDDWRT